MKNKKLLLAGLLIFVFLVLWFFLQKQKQEAPASVIYVTPPPILPSVMPKPLTGTAVLYTGEPKFEFPKSIPYITISGRRSFESETARLFALLGATTPANIITGSRGRYASVTQKALEGIISENPLSFGFVLASHSGTTVSGNTTEYQKGAISKLTEWSLLQAPFEAVLSGVRYFRLSDTHPEEQSEPKGAIIAQVDMRTAIDGFPVFTGDAVTPTFTASFDGSTTLLKINGVILPSVEKSGKFITLISYQEALQRLKNGSGVLSNVMLVPGSSDRFISGDLPERVEIQRIVLGFLYSSLQDYLVPVFVFTGTARSQKENQPLITTTVVSAL